MHGIDDSMELQVVSNCHDMVEGDGKAVLIAQTGSRAYGTERSDSDYDFKGIYIADNRRLFSLRPAAQTFDRQEPHDMTIFELAHFCKLAAKNNPTVLEILWSDSCWDTPEGRYLRAIRPLFLSKNIAKTYGGYALSQVRKARNGTGGSRGQDHFKREKFKLHTMRLLYAGQHALATGEIKVRLEPDEVTALRAASQLPMDEFERAARVAWDALQATAKMSLLPAEPRYDLIDEAIFKLRMMTWS